MEGDSSFVLNRLLGKPLAKAKDLRYHYEKTAFLVEMMMAEKKLDLGKSILRYIQEFEEGKRSSEDIVLSTAVDIKHICHKIVADLLKDAGIGTLPAVLGLIFCDENDAVFYRVALKQSLLYVETRLSAVRRQGTPAVSALSDILTALDTLKERLIKEQ